MTLDTKTVYVLFSDLYYLGDCDDDAQSSGGCDSEGTCAGP